MSCSGYDTCLCFYCENNFIASVFSMIFFSCSPSNYHVMFKINVTVLRGFCENLKAKRSFSVNYLTKTLLMLLFSAENRKSCFLLYHSAELDAHIRNEIVPLPDKQTEQRRLGPGQKVTRIPVFNRE